eukprot:Skav224046  [mRNA]  locus=scaffold534:17677:20952:- [translate_table: standard]
MALYPLLIHAVVAGQESFSSKAGFLAPLWKRKGPLDAPESYRAILIAGVLPKVMHHVARRRLASAIAPRLCTFQIGGLAKMTVHFACHYLQARKELARQAKQSHAVVYLDVCNAFYTARRSSICPLAFRMPSCLIDEDQSIQNLCESTALQDLDVPAELQRWTQVIMTGSWSQVKTSTYVQHADEAIVSLKGSRPGDPVADISFTTLMFQILQRTMQDVPDVLQDSSNPATTDAAPPVAWVDDVALFITDPSPAGVVEKVQRTVAAFAARCQQRGLHVNFKRGKSEVIFRLEGRGSQSVAAQLRDCPQGALPLPGSDDALAMTSSYVHLGQRQCAAMNHDVPAIERLGHAVAAFNETRPLFRNKHLSTTHKCTLASALILSKLLYGAELWTSVTSGVSSRLHAFVMRMYRTIFHCRNFRTSEHTTDDELRALHPIDSVSTLRKVACLRHFGKLVADAPSALLEVLYLQQRRATAGWLDEMESALKWAQTMCPCLQGHTTILKNLHFWVDYVQQNPLRWSKMCRSLRRRANRFQHIMAKQMVWARSFDAALYGPVQPAALPVQRHPFACEECDASFTTAKGLSVHKYKEHGQQAYVRQYMPLATQCGSCLKLFQNSQKLRQHLQWRNNGCLRHLEDVWHPLPSEAIAQVELVSGVVTSHRQPAAQCFGPPLPTLLQWQRAAVDKTFPLPRHRLAAEQLRHLIQEWMQTLLVENQPVCPLPSIPDVPARDRHANLEQALAHVVHSQSPTSSHEHVAFVTGQLQHALGRGQQDWSTEEPEEPRRAVIYEPPVLPLCEGQAFVLYFYAGHRREGDMHQCITEMSQAYGVPITVVPLDLVYHARLCDMLDPDSQAFWRSVVESGCCVGMLGAPPCESWSIARWRSAFGLDRGPRPIRDATSPWCLPTATLREMGQVLIANSLLQVWLLFSAIGVVKGIAWVCEHPAEAIHVPQAASIWKLPQMQALCRAGAAKVTFLQGLLGAVSAKPTTFAYYRMGALCECLQRWTKKQVDRSQSLAGKDAKGNFKTMAAKAYPQALNNALAEAFVQRYIQLEVTAVKRDVTSVPGLADALAAIAAARVSSGTQMGKDFAPRAFS